MICWGLSAYGGLPGGQARDGPGLVQGVGDAHHVLAGGIQAVGPGVVPGVDQVVVAGGRVVGELMDHGLGVGRGVLHIFSSLPGDLFLYWRKEFFNMLATSPSYGRRERITINRTKNPDYTNASVV